MQMLSRSVEFLLNGKLGVNFFSISELLYPGLEITPGLIRVKTTSYMIKENPNLSLGIADCSLFTRRIALSEDYCKKRMDMFAYRSVEYNYLEFPGKTSSQRTQLFQENIFNNAPVRRIAIALKTN